MEPNSTIIKCQCNAQMIEHTYYSDDNEHIIAFWKLSGDNDDGLISRIKAAYQILFHGKTYMTEIVLSESDAILLSEKLLKK